MIIALVIGFVALGASVLFIILWIRYAVDRINSNISNVDERLLDIENELNKI
ncbi:unnamed protein product [marine sediment metagenome]|uniref:Uncharacterized protein n=1 Tax=marine sediment metagenome TaxID=412755 RepID=X0X6W4_9ZZZZ